MRTIAGLERTERAEKPADADSLPAGMFCEACTVAVFPDEDDEQFEAFCGAWLGEHIEHGKIWMVVETEDGDVVSIGMLEREH